MVKFNFLYFRSKTGSGKTLAFLLPLEYLLNYKSNGSAQTDILPQRTNKTNIRAIIMEPTRELATQVQKQVEKFTGMNSVLLYGGGESKQI